MLLELAADKNGSVVLGVAGESYRDMLMSWACRLRHLGVTNFIVCALDHETYEFSLLQVIYLNHFLSFRFLQYLFLLLYNCKQPQFQLLILILGLASFQISAVTKQRQL